MADNFAAHNLIAPDTKVGMAFTSIQPIFAMNKEWSFWQDGPLYIYPGLEDSWKTNGLDSSNPDLPYDPNTGHGVFYFEYNGLPNLCNGNLGTVIDNGPMTHYFTTRFTVGTVDPRASFELHSVIDDGAVFYLNGDEIGRFNMPAGPVDYWTPAATSIGDAECVTNVFGVTNLVSGENLLAVELHQINQTTTDDVFGGELEARLVTFYDLTNDPPPTLNLTPNPGAANDMVLSWTGSGFALEYANKVEGPWFEAQPMANPFATASTNAMQRFWRLSLPQ